MSIVEKMLILAERKGVTRAELADMLGIEEYTIDDWRRKLREPTTADIAKAADYFGVTTDYLTEK